MSVTFALVVPGTPGSALEPRLLAYLMLELGIRVVSRLGLAYRPYERPNRAGDLALGQLVGEVVAQLRL